MTGRDATSTSWVGRNAWVGTTLAAVALVAGCSSASDGPAPASTTTPSLTIATTSSVAATPTAPAAGGSAAADGGSFPSSAAVVAALTAAGVPCEEAMPGNYPGVGDARSCILGGTEDAVVLRFASSAERANYLAAQQQLTSVVAGRDWAVQTVLPATAERVERALGGMLRTRGS